jgi:hypothetical protein
MCYGQTRDDAISNVERLAIEVIADRIAHGELSSPFVFDDQDEIGLRMVARAAKRAALRPDDL